MTGPELHALLTGDPAEAFRWVQLAASHGLASAQTRLGRMLLDGTGVAKDEAAALGWFKTAARSGDADAMNMVGRCYENGWGVGADLTLAASWYRRSAESGHDWGQYNYGHMLFDGIGVAADPRQAVTWYLKAASQGHGRAMNLAARCHEQGWGVVMDRAAATDWYRKSARSGYFRGQFNYATILLETGRIDDAADMFWRAAESGTLQMRRKIGADLSASHVPRLREVGLRILALCPESEKRENFPSRIPPAPAADPTANRSTLTVKLKRRWRLPRVAF